MNTPAGELHPERPIPLFPLPDFILFPGTVQPLRLFEARYLQMMDDLLDSPGFLVMGTVLGGNHDQLPGRAPVENVGGLGKIMGYQRLPNGEYLANLVGLARVTMTEGPSERLYRQVRVELLDPALDAGDHSELDTHLRQALRECSDPDVELPEQISVSQLADLVLLHLDLPVGEVYRLFSIRAPLDRVESILATHRERS